MKFVANSKLGRRPILQRQEKDYPDHSQGRPKAVKLGPLPELKRAQIQPSEEVDLFESTGKKAFLRCRKSPERIA